MSKSKNREASTTVTKKSALKSEQHVHDDGHRAVRTEQPAEFGGQKGPEPTRFGDWEKNGRCTDF